VTADVIAESLRQTKALAKAKPGCCCLLAAADRVIELVSRPEPAERASASRESESDSDSESRDFAHA